MAKGLARAPRRAAARVLARADAVAARRSGGRQVVTEDIAAWGRAHGLDVTTLSPAATRERRLPVPLAGASEPNFAERVRNQVDERVLLCLPGARVWGDHGLVILPDGSFSSESVYERGRLEAYPEFSTPPPWRVTRRGGDVVSLLGPFASRGNYFHWIHDGLLRLHGTDGRLPDSIRYLVPANTEAWHVELLALLGVSADRLDVFPRRRALECERLWFASLPPPSSTVPEAASWLRDRLWTAAGVDEPRPHRRLYLTRAETHHARVVNEDELAPVLARHGFETVAPERLPVVEQVRLFADAEVVVSATSSGLTNLVAAGPSTRTLEILEPEWAAQSAYIVWQFTEALGLAHAYRTGETVPDPARPDRADLRVPPATLARALEELLG